jgi:hypothetical protein
VTPQELEILRLKAKLIALEALVATLYSAVASSPASRALLIEKLDGHAASMSDLKFPNHTAEYSDLYAAELRDAVDSLNAFLIEHLNKQK